MPSSMDWHHLLLLWNHSVFYLLLGLLCFAALFGLLPAAEAPAALSALA